MDDKHWRLEDIPWDRLEPARAGEDLIKVVKTAALVEYNAEDYTHYLKAVFADDPGFCAAADAWRDEEVQHGRALGAWAERIDPAFDLERAIARFRAGYRLPHLEATNSVRGSRTGEMIARCMVETGTSSYYTAIADATDEPVLRFICRKIAGDEYRHYKLFYIYLKRYLEREGLGRFTRIKIGLARIVETEDDELAYAHYAATAAPDAVYDRKRYNRSYMRRAYSFYRPGHIDRAVAMIFKACGLKPGTWLYRTAATAMWRVMDGRARRLAAADA